MSKKPQKIITSGIEGEIRLDQYLKRAFPTWGRNAINQTIGTKQVKVNGKEVRLNSWKIKNGDSILVYKIPDAKPSPFTSFDEKWLIKEEKNFVILNKPSGLLSHATRAGGDNNLLSLARTKFGDVGMPHRLDRDTSGISVLSWQGEVNAYLDHSFKGHRVRKEYLALVAKPNRLKLAGEIKAALSRQFQRRDLMRVAFKGGDRSETHYKVVAEDDETQFLRVFPITGRMHQIRVHLEHMKAPIIGDSYYNKHSNAKRLMLHSYEMTLPTWHEYQEKTYIAPIPNDFWEILSPTIQQTLLEMNFVKDK
jgi:23S rRNA pseudouridine1911/1915/1917 synthase